MKKLLLILVCLPLLTLAQQTYVPDDNFEAYLEANGMGNGIANDDYVTTTNVSSLTILNIGWQNIADLKGIEDFTALTSLRCNSNQLTSLDLSQNTALVYLNCSDNPLISLDVSQNLDLYCFICKNTLITILDLSNNPLVGFNISDNPNLSNIDLRNGFNLAIGNGGDICYNYGFQNNQQLFCINADLPSHCDTVINTDPQNYFSTNCNGTSIQEHTTNKELLKVTDLLGRETKGTKNEVLFYIYDDGTVEKRKVIE